MASRAPDRSRVYAWKARRGTYCRLEGEHDSPLADKHEVHRHRYVMHEHLGRPTHTACHWCGYQLPWRSSLAGASKALQRCVVTDHVDGAPRADHPSNLVPSCWWCNANRRRRRTDRIPPRMRPIFCTVMTKILAFHGKGSP